jgi:argininosuccinate lyase
MPQKKNPDALELMRAKSVTLSAYADRVAAIVRPLPSGYNRDVQETKGPFIHGTRLALLCVDTMALAVRSLEADADRLTQAMRPELFATDRALELVKRGVPFRKAYRDVGRSLRDLEPFDPVRAVRSRTSSGTSGNLKLDVPRARLDSIRGEMRARHNRVDRALADLAGKPTPDILNPGDRSSSRCESPRPTQAPTPE